jgi:hypothetical protein
LLIMLCIMDNSERRLHKPASEQFWGNCLPRRQSIFLRGGRRPILWKH